MSLVEICCGSYQDCIRAQAGGADRAELNSALFLGGLTPSLGSVLLAKKHCTIPIIAMVRPRAAGFCYSDEEFENMLEDARILLDHGIDGLAFGFLDEHANIDAKRTKQMCECIHAYQKEAVFHRAFDCTKNSFESIEILITCGVDRVLTSGLQENAVKGSQSIKSLQERYGKEIEILAGCGLRDVNIEAFMLETGVQQVHSSCKSWTYDPTTIGDHVSYAYADHDHQSMYEEVSSNLIKAFVKKAKKES